jgi:hypothetical protein
MKSIPWNLLGIHASGDLADVTVYMDRHRRLVTFPKSPPQTPRTAAQEAHRQLWSIAVANWKTASTETRDAYERASLKASLMMTGHNVWMHFSFRRDAARLATLAAQTGETLPMPPNPNES